MKICTYQIFFVPLQPISEVVSENKINQVWINQP